MPDGLPTLSQKPLRGAVHASLNYLKPIAGKPHIYNYDPPAGAPRQNFESEAHSVLIEDIRGREAAFTLDRHGFAAVEHQSQEIDFIDDDQIAALYYPESEALLRDRLNAHRVFIFDHTIRRRDPAGTDREGARQPVARVHIDQTPRSGQDRVYRHLPDEAEVLVQGRVRVINLWRPIRGPVIDHPLAMADGSSIQADELVATDLLYRDRKGETYSVTFGQQQRWYYWSEMQPHEALLLKCYDSHESGITRFSPHTAFADWRADASAPPRQSIELRALVFGG